MAIRLTMILEAQRRSTFTETGDRACSRTLLGCTAPFELATRITAQGDQTSNLLYRHIAGLEFY